MNKNINLNISQELYEKMQKSFASEQELLEYFNEVIKEEAEYLTNDNYVMELDPEAK